MKYVCQICGYIYDDAKEKVPFEQLPADWECRNCGHIVVGTKAPEVCLVCAHPQAYFEVNSENY